MFSAELVEQLRRSATVSPLARTRHAVGLWQTDQRAELTEVAILQIDRRLADDVVGAQQVVVLDAYSQIFRQRNPRFQLEHPAILCIAAA